MKCKYYVTCPYSDSCKEQDPRKCNVLNPTGNEKK